MAFSSTKLNSFYYDASIENTYKVYVLQNPETEEIFYVGMTKRTLLWRLDKHHYNCEWKRNPNKMKILFDLKQKGLKANILLIKDGLSRKEALVLETETIRAYKASGVKLTNIIESNLDNISNAIGYTGQPGDKNPMFGKKHSQKTKNKMSKNRRNKRAILQLNLDQKVVAEFSDSYSAAREVQKQDLTTNKDIKSIASVISSRCRKGLYSVPVYGYNWKFAK